VLGDGGLGNTRSSPVQIGALLTWSSISAGFDCFLALQTNGKMWSWGLNGVGQLGVGDLVLRSSPTQVGTATNWQKITMNALHGQAIKTTGTLWSWGDNSNAELGHGNYVGKSTPVQVGTLSTWAQASGTRSDSIAVKTDGTMWTAGWNMEEWMWSGNNTTTNNSTFVQVGSMTTWKQASFGGMGGYAVRLDGTLWAWGRPCSGGLGITFYSPTRVGSGTNWADISMGQSTHMIATKTDGTMWAWGDNFNGTSGQNDVYDADAIPYQVGVDTDWSKVSTGPNFVTAIKTNGKAYAWGQNSNGELGRGDVATQLVPTQIGTATNWRSISIGANHAGAIRS